MKQTDTFGLDLYEAGDNANLLDGFNHNMLKLDQMIAQSNTLLLQQSRDIRLLTDTVDALTARVEKLED